MSYGPYQLERGSSPAAKRFWKRAKSKAQRLDWKRLAENAPKKNYYRGYES